MACFASGVSSGKLGSTPLSLGPVAFPLPAPSHSGSGRVPCWWTPAAQPQAAPTDPLGATLARLRACAPRIRRKSMRDRGARSGRQHGTRAVAFFTTEAPRITRETTREERRSPRGRFPAQSALQRPRPAQTLSRASIGLDSGAGTTGRVAWDSLRPQSVRCLAARLYAGGRPGPGSHSLGARPPQTQGAESRILVYTGGCESHRVMNGVASLSSSGSS